jgi:hypothetical protein
MGKLGQVLVARGWITVQQLNRAMRHQQFAGGRLGTCLLELDTLSEELLLRGLAEHHGVPAVAGDELRNIPLEVLELIPDKLARRCRAVPFRLESGRLDVALIDPRNLSAQDEIAFASGKRVRVHVALEIRVMECLERYYGEEMSSRLSLVLDRLNRARYLWERKEEKEEPFAAAVQAGVNPFFQPSAPRPAPPLPAMPARPAPAIPPAQPKPEPRRPRAEPAPNLSAVPAAALPVAAPKTETPAVAKPAPPPRPVSIALTREEKQELGTAPSEITTVEQAEAALAAAGSLDEVAAIVLAYLGHSHRRVALFRVVRDRVTGWTAQGVGVDPEAFAKFSLGFDQPSLFLNLRQGSGLHLGPLPPMPAHRELARTWGGDLPRDCVVLPVRVRDRLVTVIYCDGAQKGTGGIDLPALQRLLTAVTAAYERSILAKKKSGAKS